MNKRFGRLCIEKFVDVRIEITNKTKIPIRERPGVE